MTKRREPPRPFSPLAGLSPSSTVGPSPQTRETRRSSVKHHGHASSAAKPSITETTLRTRMHPDDKRRVESLCVRLSESLRATVRPSNLMRSLLLLAQDCEPSLQAEARGVRGLRRPANDDRQGMAEFERLLAVVLRDGVARTSR